MYFNDPWGLQTEDPNKANGFKKRYDGNVNNLPNASEGVTVTGTRKKGLPPPPPAGANATPPRPITMGDIVSSNKEAPNTGGNNGGGGMQTVYTEGALSQGGQGGGNEPASKAEYHRKGESHKPASKQSTVPGGKVNSFGLGVALFGGYQLEIGTVRDAFGNSRWFISHGPVIGVAVSLGFSEKGIRSNNNKPFNVNDYEGPGSGYSLGILIGGMDYSGNKRNQVYQNSDWNPQGADYNQLGFGIFQGLDFGLSWSRTNTSFINKR